MLDLETLATGPDCVILSFGAVKFDPFDDTAPMDKALYFRLDVDEQIAMGRDVNDGTVEWWQRQPKAVQEAAFGGDDRTSMDEFTKQLNKFVVGCDRIWAQGPVFDIVILENLYRQLGKPCPWNYYSIRDSRTLLKALGDSRNAGKNELHDALADCVYQAKAVQDAVKRYELTQL